MGFANPRELVEMETLTDQNFDTNLASITTNCRSHRSKARSREVNRFSLTLGPRREEIGEGRIVQQPWMERTASRRAHPLSPGRLVCQSVARSKTRAVRRRLSSAKAGAISWRPIGRPDRVKPQGMLMPGMPARFVVIV